MWFCYNWVANLYKMLHWKSNKKIGCGGRIVTADEKDSEVWSFISKTEVLSAAFVIIKADALMIIIYTDTAFFWHQVQRPGFEIKV